VYVASLDGQTIIANTNIIVNTPLVDQSLYVSDVYSINSIFDFSYDGTYRAVTDANYQTLKTAGVLVAGGAANVTSRYVLNTGQKDSFYDWSAIRLKAGQVPPKGPLLICYNRFRSTGTGYFDVDSYTRLGPSNFTYQEIPIFTTLRGSSIPLRDMLDFRPVRLDASSEFTANNYVFDVEERGAGPKIPEPGSDLILDYSYYLPRVDRVILRSDGQFEVMLGEPSLAAVAPVESPDSMTLYILSHPAYLGYASSTVIQRFGNKRYTMKDIGGLEKRIENLEYYTSLSLTELATLGKADLSVLDTAGLPRTKSGMIVDSFIDKTVAGFTFRDFSSSIDIINNLARNSYNLYSTKIFSNNSILDSYVEYNGPLLTLSSTTETFVTQNLASKSININPFAVTQFVGSILLDPPSDVWRSDTRLEAQRVDLTGGEAARDAWVNGSKVLLVYLHKMLVV
jgi:hypothetical protein